uniref:MSP domain-containing protein n=1 Tax=Panagrolaimus superbus TaxID=310955 RepID=A0A914Y247_9BILA
MLPFCHRIYCHFVQISSAGGSSTHQLVNSGASRLAFKVKSSNNTEYRLKPVFGFVEAGASAPLEITRLAIKIWTKRI